MKEAERAQVGLLEQVLGFGRVAREVQGGSVYVVHQGQCGGFEARLQLGIHRRDPRASIKRGPRSGRRALQTKPRRRRRSSRREASASGEMIQAAAIGKGPKFDV